MISRRRLITLSVAGTVLAAAPYTVAWADAPEATSAVHTIRTFYAALLAMMRNGPTLGFAGRRNQLEPAVQRAFDLPRMTRLAVGLRWRKLTPQQQQELISAFGSYSAATYAGRFTSDQGERFVVADGTTPTREGIIVHTKLIPHKGDPVQLDYLMRQSGGDWKIEDVYLSGTISELATRRSEFSAVLDRGGAQALVDALRRKAADQHG